MENCMLDSTSVRYLDFFETGDFDITVPVNEKISEVIVKSGSYEHSVWDSSSSQSEGVFVRVEGGNVYCVSVSYEGMNKQPESRVVENSSDILLDHDIMMTAQEINAQVPFTVTTNQPESP